VHCEVTLGSLAIVCVLWVVGGWPWKAGFKTRAMLVSDYVTMMKEEGKGEEGYSVHCEVTMGSLGVLCVMWGYYVECEVTSGSLE
jgi:hypothetical protein